MRGGIKSYIDGTITGIPDATTYHTESSETYAENTWLVDAQNYLEVNGVEYNSLQKAYDAITGESGTIKVIADIAVEAVLPHSPAGKNITFDLNGHEIIYSQMFFNDGTMTILDSSTGKTGKLLHPTNSNATISNGGNLTIESGYISAGRMAIWNDSGSTFTMTGGEISSANYGIYNDNGSSNSPITVTVSNATIFGSSYGIYNAGTYGTNNVNNTILRSNYCGIYRGTNIIDGSTSNVEGATYGIQDGTTTLNGGTIKSSLYGISGGSITMNDGAIVVNHTAGSGSAAGIAAGNLKVNILGGSITVTSNASSTYGISTFGSYNSVQTLSVNNCAITVTGTNTSSSNKVYGIAPRHDRQSSTISNSTITVTSEKQDTYGVYLDNSFGSGSATTSTLTNNIITSTSTSGSGAGVYVNKEGERAYISGGKITGSTYGVYLYTNSNNTYGGLATIGNNDGEISTESPEIIGGSYALYGYSANFYDGVLRGGIKSYIDGTIKAVADNSTIHMENQLIEGTTYEALFLAQEHNVAKIGDHMYTKLSDAINDAEAGETIDLVDDNYLFYTLNIDAGKDVTIKTNGYKIHQGNPIVNNGNVSIIDNSTSPSTVLDYYGAGYSITNNANASLSLTEISINAYNGISNGGTLSLEKCSIMVTATAVSNSGTITAQNNIRLDGATYPLYNNGGTMNISNANITRGQLYNNSGIMALTSSSASRTGASIQTYVTNNGTMRLNSTNITLTNTKLNLSGNVYYMRTIYNKGTLEASNNSSINHIANLPTDYAYEHVSSIYNDNGTIIAEDSDIIADTTQSHSDDRQTHGIYNPSGNVTIKSGSVQAYGSAYSYGILNNTGNITLGVPEPQTSQHYGRDTADVSTTAPAITAIDTRTSGTRTGIGVKNSTGKVYFYDGKVAGSTAALPEEPAGTEYLYEICTELDTTVTPNLYTAKLFWMRDGQSTCANN